MARRTGLVLILAIGGILMLVLASVGAADHGKGNGKSHGKGKNRSVEAKLSGYQEVPAISTTGKGKIKLKMKNSTSIEYQLSYSGLSTPAVQGHIHFAQWGVNGGISAWLCDSATNPSPSATTPECQPGNNGSKVKISGTITAAEVVGPAAQGIAAGELTELMEAIKAGVAYANVHTTTYPGGEIRGQLDRGKKRDD
jgi:CHRD domain